MVLVAVAFILTFVGSGAVSMPALTQGQAQITSTFQDNVLTVSVENAFDLTGFQFAVNYNPEVLELGRFEPLLPIEEGAFLNNNGAEETFFTYSQENEPGLIKGIVAARLGKKPGVKGSGELAKVYFTAKGEGNPEISISGSIITNSAAEKVPHQVMPVEIGEQAQQPATQNAPGFDFTLALVAVVVIVAIAVFFFVAKK